MERLLLQPHKLTQVQVSDRGDYERRTYFCNLVLWAVHDSVLDPSLTIFTH